MTRRFLSALFAVSAGLASTAGATIVVNLQADALKNAFGTLLPANTLALLIASTTDNVFSPVDGGATVGIGSLIAGTDDYIVGIVPSNVNSRPDVGVLDVAFSSSGAGAITLGNPVTFGGGDRLALVWFPGLLANASTIPAGSSYGSYTDPVGVDLSAPWITPADGAQVNLGFFTQDGGFFSPGPTASNGTAAGNATLTTTPEPSSLVFCAIGALAGLYQRRRGRN